MMDTQILQAMRPFGFYRAEDIAAETGCDKRSASRCLRSLYKGGVINREKQIGRTYVYQTKQMGLFE